MLELRAHKEVLWQAKRDYVEQMVTIHYCMFKKLLSGKELPLEIAELLEDAGNTYKRMSAEISRDYLCGRGGEVE